MQMSSVIAGAISFNPRLTARVTGAGYDRATLEEVLEEKRGHPAMQAAFDDPQSLLDEVGEIPYALNQLHQRGVLVEGPSQRLRWRSPVPAERYAATLNLRPEDEAKVRDLAEQLDNYKIGTLLTV